MKKLVLAFCMVVGALVAVNAQDTTSTEKQPQPQYPTQGAQGDAQDDRERINSSDLPDAVKRSLEGTEYRGWLVNSAFKMKGTGTEGDQTQKDAENPTDSTAVKPETEVVTGEIFVVELKNGAQTKTVRFDKEGKKLDDPNDDQDNK